MPSSAGDKLSAGGQHFKATACSEVSKLSVECLLEEDYTGECLPLSDLPFSILSLSHSSSYSSVLGCCLEARIIGDPWREKATRLLSEESQQCPSTNPSYALSSAQPF